MDNFNLDDFMSLDSSSNLALWSNSELSIQPLEQSLPPSTVKARNYRPRNPRSCDYCRGRKTACRIEGSPPCVACRQLRRDCTFAERPRKRRRQDASLPGQMGRRDENPSPDHGHGKSLSLRSDSSADERGMTGLISTTHVSNKTDHAAGANSRRPGPEPPTDRSPGAREVPPLARDLEDSIDGRAGQTAFLLGDTGESDPYLLRHSSLAAADGKGASKISYRQIHHDRDPLFESDERDDSKPLVFMFADHSLHEKYEPRINDDIFRRAETELESMCPEEVGIRLIKLFFKYVYPYFPILSRSQMIASEPSAYLKSLPLSLKAVLYATGLPFMVYDDVLATMLDLNMPSAQSLYRICWLAIAQETHTPHLSTLQSCLLLLQRVNDDRYVMDSPFRWSLLAWAISLAQGLGLSTDCSHWKGIPAWEKRLRRRLWWAVFVMDKWSFSSAGISSHIKNEDFDVNPLNSADFISNDMEPHTEFSHGNLHQLSHFYHLVELSLILSDVIDAYFTIRASKRTRSNFGLAIELARPFRSRLQEWKESYDVFASSSQLAQPELRLDGNASLGLLYPVATMILFRALLRPLESSEISLDDRIIMEGKDAVRTGAKACCVEVVQYLEQVKRGVWDAFWHSWARASFAIASSFMMRLLITSSSAAETEELNSLIKRWRWAMRTGGGNSGNVLMSLGLLRLDRSLLKSGILELDNT